MTDAAVRRAAVGQFALLAERFADLSEADFDRDTRLAPWRVRELVAHTTRNICSVVPALSRPEPEQATVDLDDYYDKGAQMSAAIRDRAVDEARADVRWAEELAAAVRETREVLAAVGPDRLISVRLGAMSLDGFLVTRCVEGVVHGLDLAHALGGDPARWTTPEATEICAGQLARIGARAGVPAAVSGGSVTVGSVTVPAVAYVEWATGRTPAPHPALAGYSPVLR